jgi:sterol 3beta-glucosyltransferase
MHITVVALGSRGDVQPCVALGVGLRQAGYEVRIATYGVFADFVGHYGLEFAPVAGDPRQAMEGQAGQQWLESGKSLVKFVRRMRGLSTFESLNQGLNDTVEACRGTDAILYTVLGAAGYHVAESMNVPAIYLLLQPFSRSREIPSIFAPILPLGGVYNRWTYVVAEQLFWQMVRVPVNHWRRETLKLKPIPFGGPFDMLYQKQAPFIYGFSRYVVPQPHDWPDWHHITGYWFLNGAEKWSPPPELLRFLSGGPKPIYIGFGSMSGHLARHLADLAIEAVTMSKQRAVLLGGWAAVHDLDLPDSIYMMESAPHVWLLPRMAAVVHHGGAGTTAAGLRAGVPSVIIPFFGDQPYWGRRIDAFGAGPKPILRSDLTARRLADAIIQAVTDQSMQSRSATLGEKIRGEDGVARAVEIISRYVRG